MSEDLDAMFEQMKEPSKTKAEGKTSAKKRGRPKSSASSPVETKKTAKTKKAKVSAVETPQKDKKVLEFIDTRNLTKQGKASVIEQWEASNRGNTRNSLMNSLMQSAQEKFGAGKVFGTRTALDQLVIGIPIPALPFEYILANDVFPLQIVMMLAGSWGSCKSALSYEIFRWFYENSGITVHIDAEDKFDADFACQIMRVANDVIPIISNQATSLEESQKLITYYIDAIKKMLIGNKENPGPGARVPCCLCLDSVAGNTSETTQKKILDEGFAGKSYAVEALSLAKFLPTIKSTFTNFPFTLLLINHAKEKNDEMGNKHVYTLGGGALNFHESFEIHNSVWKSGYNNTQFEGVGITLKCVKNSFGPTGRRARTRFIWWQEEDPETGNVIEHKLWDWNWAICDLFVNTTNLNKKRLKDRDLILNVKAPTADIECMANMPALGMGKNEYLTFQEVGQMIHENEEISNRIRDALGIKRRYVLDGSKTYEDIVNEHVTEDDDGQGEST